jgi:hypothetical protein
MICMLLAHVLDGEIVHDKSEGIDRVLCSDSPGVWRADQYPNGAKLVCSNWLASISTCFKPYMPFRISM